MKKKANYQNFICDNCRNVFQKYMAPSVRVNKYNYCSDECRVTGMKGKGTGSDNSNFGKRWNDDRKVRQSEIIKSKVDEEYRLNCAKGMSGVTVSEETKKKRVETRLKKYGKFGPDLVHTEESKAKIGRKSSEKFTDEFKERFYENMVEKGIWVPRESKNPYHFYRSLANWNCNVLDYDVIGSDLFYEFGFFHIKTNTKGMVRDHRFSRLNGFKNLVFPEILRHPFNCEFIQHGDNARKHHSKKINSDSITMNELFEGIKTYEKEYKEQSICLEKIKQYENGLRYDANDYLKIY